MKSALVLVASLLLAACGSGGPPPPDWKTDAADLIGRYQTHALKGENILAEKYFGEALRAAGGAGQVQFTARLWLVHCAVRRAMLIDDPCTGYRELATNQPADDAYLRYLTLDWSALDPALLPPQHARIPVDDAATRRARLAQIDEPLARLVAIGLVTARGEADFDTLHLAVETASERGWRQPLLVYLKLARDAAPDAATRDSLDRRRLLVERSLTP